MLTELLPPLETSMFPVSKRSWLDPTSVLLESEEIGNELPKAWRAI